MASRFAKFGLKPQVSIFGHGQLVQNGVGVKANTPTDLITKTEGTGPTMTQIHEQWRATFLRRWHSNADLAQTVDTLAGHQGRVAMMLIAYWPDSQACDIHYALTHDLPESHCGDVCGQAKRENPELASALSHVENKAAKQLGLDWCVTIEGIQRVQFCDKLDAYLWMKHHRPDLADKDGWPEAFAELKSKADNLGIELMEEMK